jgi:hypothetical protein
MNGAFAAVSSRYNGIVGRVLMTQTVTSIGQSNGNDVSGRCDRNRCSAVHCLFSDHGGWLYTFTVSENLSLAC